MKKGAIVILAAGGSFRLGKPKQTLLFNSNTLLGHIVDEALLAGLHTIVVTGANREEVEASIEGKDVILVYNPGWQTGMASGIQAGVNEALKVAAGLPFIITAVCDQPFVKAALLLQLAEKSKGGKGIVACSYAGTLGTPVLFTPPYFYELLALEGDHGAKGLLRRFADDVAIIAFAEGAIDIDTESDYKMLLDKSK